MGSIQQAAERSVGKAMQETIASTGNPSNPHSQPEVVARMTGELSIHLNDMLNLAKLLADNPGNNLTVQQIDYAQTIYSIGAHLLSSNDHISASANIEPSFYSAEQLPVPGAASVADNAVVLMGMKVLIVSADIRAIYAMTGLLEQQGMVVLHTDSGAAAIEVLRGNTDTEVVLLDTMDQVLGSQYTCSAIATIATMRGIEGCEALPVITLTARADDREKCMAIGASDTIEKPVNVEQLLSLLRAWLGELR